MEIQTSVILKLSLVTPAKIKKIKKGKSNKRTKGQFKMDYHAKKSSMISLDFISIRNKSSIYKSIPQN